MKWNILMICIGVKWIAFDFIVSEAHLFIYATMTKLSSFLLIWNLCKCKINAENNNSTEFLEVRNKI